MSDTILYLVRHAETTGNVERIFGGDSDITPNGAKETRRLFKKLRSISPVSIYASELKRSKQTAKILADEWNIPLRIHTKLRERNYGSLEEKKVSQKHVDLHDRIIRENIEYMWDYHLTHDDETNRHALKRLLSALEDIAAENFEKTSLIVGHGNIIRCLLIYMGIGTFAEIRGSTFENNGYIKILYNNKKFQILEVVGLQKIKI